MKYNKIFTSIIVLVLMFVLAGCNAPQGQTNGALPGDVDLNGSVDLPTGEVVKDTETEVETNMSGSNMTGTEDVSAKDENATETDVDSEECIPSDVNIRDITKIDSLYRIEVNETDLVRVRLKAVDPDGDPVTYSYGKPLNASGEWQTVVGDAGEYLVKIIASDGKADVSQDIIVVVIPLNRAPVLLNLSDMTVKEGETIKLFPVVEDDNKEEAIITYKGFMTSYSYTVTYQDAGTHNVTVTASDGELKTSKTIIITVEDVNLVPSLSPIKSIKASEGDIVTIKPNATDADGDNLTITYSKPLDSKGKWQTEIGDAGVYNITVGASDGVEEVFQSFTLTIEKTNSAPKITGFADITVDEGDKIELKPTITDADGDNLTITYSGFMSSSSYQTTYKDSGKYSVVLSVSDGTTKVNKTISVTVKDKNREPVFGTVNDMTITEGELADVKLTATDADGDELTYTYDSPLNSSGQWKTKFGDKGSYALLVTVSDGKANKTATIKLTVKSSNNQPVIDIAGEMTVSEGDIVRLEPVVTDADGDDVSVTYSGWMTGSEYQTTYEDAGVYQVKITADDGKETVEKTVKITVVDKNRPPVFVPK